jgi:pyruvate/2-oxoacid:ferredoxin oxidoreductase alpha subunit
VESNQEALDTVIQAFKISEAISLPSMILMDAFFLSHTYEIVDLPSQEEVDAFLPPFEPKFKLDPQDPHSFGSMSLQDYFMEFRYKIHRSMEEAKGVIEATEREFENRFGRHYGSVIPYLLDDAEIALVTSGTISGTARIVVDRLRKDGWKIGMLRIRLLRPFPTEEIRSFLAGMEKIAVIDRNTSFGRGGVFASEIMSSLYNFRGHRPPVFGYVVGLGGRDVVPDVILEIAKKTKEADHPVEECEWIGIR